MTGMGNIALSQDGGICRMSLSGDFTVQHADGLRASLHAALMDGGELEIDVTGVESVDITFFQLFESLLKTARGLDRTVTFPGGASSEMRKRAAELGLSVGCGMVADVLAR